MLVPFLAAEIAAHWLQGEGRDRGRGRGKRDKRRRDVSAAGVNFFFPPHQEIQLIIRSVQVRLGLKYLFPILIFPVNIN